MGPDVVVVDDEAVDGPLELLLRLDVFLGGHELLECLVASFDLAAGLRVVGTGVPGIDAEGNELGLEVARPSALGGGEDGTDRAPASPSRR
jgi:hypothetical protein